jgi:hypothetical protein
MNTLLRCPSNRVQFAVSKITHTALIELHVPEQAQDVHGDVVPFQRIMQKIHVMNCFSC